MKSHFLPYIACPNLLGWEVVDILYKLSIYVTLDMLPITVYINNNILFNASKHVNIPLKMRNVLPLSYANSKCV